MKYVCNDKNDGERDNISGNDNKNYNFSVILIVCLMILMFYLF